MLLRAVLSMKGFGIGFGVVVFSKRRQIRLNLTEAHVGFHVVYFWASHFSDLNHSNLAVCERPFLLLCFFPVAQISALCRKVTRYVLGQSRNAISLV